MIDFCLQIQQHEHQPVSITVLEVWLMLQDIPVAERHPDFTAPLFSKVLNIIVERIKFPFTFTTWYDENDLDQQEFIEMRSMVNDVLVSTFYLLRMKYIEQLYALLTASNEWNLHESAIYCLCATSNDICGKIQAKLDPLVGTEEKNIMTERLLNLLQLLCSSSAQSVASKHPLLLAASVKFIGSFTMIWNRNCEIKTIVHLLSYLQKAIDTCGIIEDSSLSIKCVLIGCSGKLISAFLSQDDKTLSNEIIAIMITFMELASKMNEHVDDAIIIAEGCSRLCFKLGDSPVTSAFLCSIQKPVLERIEQAMFFINQNNSQSHSDLPSAFQALSLCMRILREIYRFSDGIKEADRVLSDSLNAVWPVLKSMTYNCLCRKNSDVIEEILGVYSGLMKLSSSAVSAHTSEIMHIAMDMLRECSSPASLDCVAVAVEIYGTGQERDFGLLLTSLTNIVIEKQQNINDTNIAKVSVLNRLHNLCKIKFMITFS